MNTRNAITISCTLYSTRKIIAYFFQGIFLVYIYKILKFQRVSAVIDRKVWQVDTLRLTDTLESSEVKRVIKNETEKERKRKMSAPYGASVEITDMQFHERCRRLSNVHEDLFKLFSIHNACIFLQVSFSRFHLCPYILRMKSSVFRIMT